MSQPGRCPGCGLDPPSNNELPGFDPDRIFHRWSTRCAALRFLFAAAGVAFVGGLALLFLRIDIPFTWSLTMAEVRQRINFRDWPTVLGFVAVLGSPLAYGICLAVLYRCPACGAWPIKLSQQDDESRRAEIDPEYCPSCRVRLR